MKKFKQPGVVLLLVLAVIFAGEVASQAQTGGGYDLTWNTVNSGYMFSTGGSYSLGGTAGQAGAETLSGGVYTLSGGFWNLPPEPVYKYKIYLPLVVKQ